jgi:hypothetical protein
VAPITRHVDAASVKAMATCCPSKEALIGLVRNEKCYHGKWQLTQ